MTGTDGQVAVQVPGRLSHSPGYLALTGAVARHASGEVLDLLGAYFAVGEPELLTGLLPIADRVDPALRQRIVEDCHTALAPFVDPAGGITAPIEAHLIAASRT